MNKVILLGNLGKDPEMFTFDNGVKKGTFSLATSESYKDKEGNKVTQTEWHNVVVWRAWADVAETYLTKGNQILVEGKIKTRSWDDKDGVKRYSTEIHADYMRMLSSKKETSDEPKAEPIQAPEDDLPF